MDYLTSRPKSFGCINPRSPLAKEWFEMFGSDHVELMSSRVWHFFGHQFVRGKVSAMGPDQLSRYSRMIGRKIGANPRDILLDAVHGSGISVSALHVHVTDDPDRGRAFWDLVPQEFEGGSDAL